MKKFLLRCFYFSIPIVVYAVIILLIDPFNYLNNTLLFTYEEKEQIASKFDPRYWKVIDYKYSKSNTIILGDSRSGFDMAYFKKKTGKNAYNFSLLAATLDEVIEGFWYISKNNPNLEAAYIGINFNLYNKYNNKNLLSNAVQKNSLANYIFESVCYKVSYYLVSAKLSGKVEEIGKPTVSAAEFWKQQLDADATKYYSLYKYPDNYYKKLGEIANYCIKNNIKLTFFSPPTHIDLQQQIATFSLEKENEQFKSDIKSLATFIDFEYANELTSDKSNYGDPFHVKWEYRYKIIDGLIDLQDKYSMRYERTTFPKSK